MDARMDVVAEMERSSKPAQQVACHLAVHRPRSLSLRACTFEVRGAELS